MGPEDGEGRTLEPLTAPLQLARHTEQVQRKHPDTGSAGGFLLPEGKAGTPV